MRPGSEDPGLSPTIPAGAGDSVGAPTSQETTPGRAVLVGVPGSF
jgi:hypothetical protein